VLRLEDAQAARTALVRNRNRRETQATARLERHAAAASGERVHKGGAEGEGRVGGAADPAGRATASCFCQHVHPQLRCLAWLHDHVAAHHIQCDLQQWVKIPHEANGLIERGE
jgi:hypothetical protein